MKTVEIYTTTLNPFFMNLDDACMMLAVLITNDRNNKFWWGSSNDSINGEMSLYINRGEFVKKLSDYKKFDIKDIFNDDFCNLEQKKQEELKNKFLKEKIGPHDYFMLFVGNNLND